MAPGALAQVLRPLSTRHDPNILVGLQTSDDAAVYKVSDDVAIVETVDFFPPVVDDPYTYGAIAAVNSMSDIFAMGGDVLFALNIAAYPEDLPLEILSEIFEGGAAKAEEAGIVIAGGHTVTDDEPKYGLIVTGSIDPNRILTKSGARPGDRVYLTKPLGTGVITTAIKQDAADKADADAAIESMLKLNRSASQIIRESRATACTDITGFGLLGHATEIATRSEIAIEFDAAAFPWLPGAVRYAEEGRLPGGQERNREYYESHPECGVTFGADVPATTIDLLYDPETSGGLLFSIPEEHASDLETTFSDAGHELWPVGTVQAGRGITVR